MLLVEKLVYEGGEDELHREVQLFAGNDDRIGARHETVAKHGEQVREVDAAGVGKTNYQHGFGGCRNPPGDKGIRRIDGRHALEIDVCLRELWADVSHVVRHAPKDGVRYRLGRITTGGLVPVDLLNPFQVDHRHDTDLQVDMTREVYFLRHGATVEALVKQEITRR